MAAGKFGGQSWTFQIDDLPGGTLRTVTAFILSVDGIRITSELQEVTCLGDSYKKFLPSGMASSGGPVTIRGLWDTTATTGPHAVFAVPDDGPQDAMRTLTASPGDSKSYAPEGYLFDYHVIGAVGKLTEFEAKFQPSGTVVWA